VQNGLTGSAPGESKQLISDCPDMTNECLLKVQLFIHDTKNAPFIVLLGLLLLILLLVLFTGIEISSGGSSPYFSNK
jgi:hypothetical protein